MTLILDLFTSKRGHESPTSWAAFLPFFIFLRLSVLDLMSGTGQRDGRTDRRRTSMHNAPTLYDGSIIKEFICVCASRQTLVFLITLNRRWAWMRNNGGWRRRSLFMQQQLKIHTNDSSRQIKWIIQRLKKKNSMKWNLMLQKWPYRSPKGL